MKRPTKTQWKVAALLALALATAALAGCVSGEREDDGMELPEVWGYVAGERFAQLDVVDQEADDDTLMVKRVLVPADAWIVVHVDDDGMPGDRVGLKHIAKGESRNVEAPLKGATEKVIVSVHADRGMPDKFDFDMMNKMQSPDRPFFVNDKELAKAIELEGSDSQSKGARESAETTGEPSMTTTPTQDASGQVAPSDDSAIEDDSSRDPSMDDASAGDDSSANKDEKDDSSMSDSSEDSAMDDDSSSKSESSGEGEEMAESETESSPPWALLGGFALVNAGIIAVAAILKRRSAKAKTEGSQGNA